MYNTTSRFPTEVDDRTLLSDVDIQHELIYTIHNDLIKSGKYTEASSYINSQEGITPITAELFQMIDNKIIALETYLKAKAEQGSVNKMHIGNTPPEDTTKTPIWIADVNI